MAAAEGAVDGSPGWRSQSDKQSTAASTRPHMPLLCILVIFLLQQGRKEDLKSVVEHLRKRYSVQYIYCWHGGCGERDGWMDGRMYGYGRMLMDELMSGFA